MTYPCPGLAAAHAGRRPPAGQPVCRLAGHDCPPAEPDQTTTDTDVVTTWRCPCCGHARRRMTLPKAWVTR